MNGRVFLIGAGTCRVSPEAAQTSACVILGSTTLLIDAGYAALQNLVAVGGLENCKELHVHISHRHTDHAIGIFPLLQGLTWSDDSRELQVKHVCIHATHEVCELIQQVRKLWGENETNLDGNFPGSKERRLEFFPGPDFADWEYEAGGFKFQSVHLPAANNHGLRFELNGKRYAFTADATEVNEGLFAFLHQADVGVFDFGHITNIEKADQRYELSLNQAVELAVRSNAKHLIATHVYLRHLQHEKLSEFQRAAEIERIMGEFSEKARLKGFGGQIALGTEKLELT